MLPIPHSHGPLSDGAAPEREILRTYFENLLYLLLRQAAGLAEEALRRVRLTRDDVATASERLSSDAFYALLSWLHASHALPVPGLQVGLRLSLGDFGIFGQALLSAGLRRGAESRAAFLRLRVAPCASGGVPRTRHGGLPLSPTTLGGMSCGAAGPGDDGDERRGHARTGAGLRAGSL